MTKKLKKVFFVYLADDNTGEVEAMFDAKGNLLDTWCRNDGNWRGEYFDGFIAKLGYEVVYEKATAKMIQAVRDAWDPR